ncbi:nitrile hydratase subunit beta [Paraburkholderia bannensis]|uniref:nitrile hydratase subunit beta n=1 Tax=Paraburkholderia bannensis TaxID=765414 RepID=UPI002AB698CC|nr:nitrile hydratase subunit beta [Paraburkholderia bannensis]
MNGVHDLGGMHGFGSVSRGESDTLFVHPWEAKVAGVNAAIWFAGAWCADEARASIETMPPVDYLSCSYYERWLYFMEDLLVRKGIVTDDELRSGHVISSGQGSEFIAKVEPGRAYELFRKGGAMARKLENPPKFRPGDWVTITSDTPNSYTRVPRYARGKRGIIVKHYGGVAFADSRARGEGDQPKHLYTVSFTASELWGASAVPHDRVNVEMYESYFLAESA